jgi:large subunit ribosomal protein L29
VPILRVNEIRAMSLEEREERLQKLRTELTKIKTMVKAGGSIENPGRSKALKKEIARILTVKNEEEE